MANLKEIELIGNTVSRKPTYRQFMVKRLPGLIMLDGRVTFYFSLINFLKEITAEERERIELFGGMVD